MDIASLNTDVAPTLAHYRILDTQPEPAYESLVRIAARTLDTQIAGIGFASGGRLWFKSSIGLGCGEVPFEKPVCGSSDVTRTVRLIPDAWNRDNGRMHPLAACAPDIRFYASVPLVTSDGVGIGVFFVASTMPRAEMATEDLTTLTDLAQIVMAGLATRKNRITTLEALAKSEVTNRLLAAASAAPSVSEAVRRTMTVLTDSVGACACLVWHLREGHETSRLVAAVARGPLESGEFLAEVRRAAIRSAGTPSGAAVRSGQQIITRSIAAEGAHQLSLKNVCLRHGILSQIITPLRIAGEDYSMGLGFGRPDVDLDHVATVILEASQAFIPPLTHAIESERTALFHRIVEASTDSVVVTDASPLDEPGPRMVYVNSSFEKMTGYTAAEMIGRSPRMLQGPLTDPAALARMHAALAADQPTQERVINYRADGTPFTVDLSIAPVKDSEGQTTHFVAIERDATERLRAEEQRRHQAGLLADAMRLARLGTWRVDLETDTVQWSDEIYAMFGLDRALGDITRERVVQLIHPDDLLRSREWLLGLIATNSPQRIEYRCIRPDGRIIHCWLEGRHRIDPVSGISVLDGICQDVTERRETENALLQAETLRTIGQMTGGVAHDFNNLLTIISVSLDLAETAAEGDDEMLSLIRAAQNAADKGAHLTNQLLSYARRQRLTPRAITPNSFVAGIASVMPRTLGAQFRVVTKVELGAEAFMADAGQLEAAVVNLFINARDAQPHGGELRLHISPANVNDIIKVQGPHPQTGRYTMITVSDQGMGMDSETLAKAFEPFFTTKPVGKGTGLGLSMVKGFARQSGGFVTIDTAPGHGTSVTIYLPVAAEDAAYATPQAPVAPGKLPPVEVLLVEDRDDVREAVARLCTECGLLPTPAASAQEALSYLKAGVRFGLLFTTAELGGDMTGADLAAAARLLQHDLPVLLTSGAGDQTPAALHVLRKPYSRDTLIAAVRRTINASVFSG